MGSQVNPSGELAEIVVLATTITFWFAVAWLYYELVNAHHRVGHRDTAHLGQDATTPICCA